jgi:cobalt-zinc-cadmium efflux system protein
MADHHDHKHENSGLTQARSLLFTTGLNILITIVEIIGGLLSNSLALLSDAIHNLGDTFAILLAYIANVVGKREATEKKTFGYKRIEILSAFLSALILIIITIFLFIEAWHRFFNPRPINGRIMFVVAVVGLLANLFSVLILKKHSGHSLNIKAAYLHLFGDTISSVAVIIGSAIIYFYHILWVDPVITLLIGIYIIKEAFNVLKEASDILMQGTPGTLELSVIVNELEAHNEISNIHHVHSWKLDDKQIHFECHIDLINDLPVSETDLIRRDIEHLLKNKFGITHVTIQFEYDCCTEKSLIHPKKSST